jgi:hypothetical protein
MRSITQACMFTVVENFLEILAKFIDFFGVLNPKLSSIFLYHVPFPQNLHCQ